MASNSRLNVAKSCGCPENLIGSGLFILIGAADLVSLAKPDESLLHPPFWANSFWANSITPKSIKISLTSLYSLA